MLGIRVISTLPSLVYEVMFNFSYARLVAYGHIFGTWHPSINVRREAAWFYRSLESFTYISLPCHTGGVHSIYSLFV